MTSSTTTRQSAAEREAEWQAIISTVQGHAAACGQLGCGHLGKSGSLAVRRAVILYTAEGMGATVSLDDEPAEVAAVLGILRETRHARPVFVRSGRRNVEHTAGVTTVLPDPTRIRMTPQRREVFGFMLRGHSATEISSDPLRMTGGQPNPRVGLTGRTIETVKSHAGYLRRETSAHDAHSALLVLAWHGKLTDSALTWPDAPESWSATDAE